MTMKQLVLVVTVAMMLAVASLSTVSAFAADKTYPATSPAQGATTSDVPVKPNDTSDTTRSSEQLTPTDQSLKRTDVEVTRLIRKELMADSSLSMRAHNVKIITLKGVITLRGSVKSEEEHEKVLAAAKKFMGNNTLNDKLKVNTR